MQSTNHAIIQEMEQTINQLRSTMDKELVLEEMLRHDTFLFNKYHLLLKEEEEYWRLKFHSVWL